MESGAEWFSAYENNIYCDTLLGGGREHNTRDKTHRNKATLTADLHHKFMTIRRREKNEKQLTEFMQFS